MNLQCKKLIPSIAKAYREWEKNATFEEKQKFCNGEIRRKLAPIMYNIMEGHVYLHNLMTSQFI